MDAIVRRAVLETACLTTPQAFCQSLVAVLTGATTVLTRIWIAGPDGALNLTGSAGLPVGGGTYNRLDGAFARIPPGSGKIGEICATRQPFVVRAIRGDEAWLANPGWIARQAVRAFVGYPLMAGDEVVGALAIFDRTAPSDLTLDALRFVADYAALRLIDLRDRAALQARLLARVSEAPSDRPDAVASSPHRVVTRADWRALEKKTIESALAQTRGRVFGPRGAAALLAMKPTTLASRIKALQIDRRVTDGGRVTSGVSSNPED